MIQQFKSLNPLNLFLLAFFLLAFRFFIYFNLPEFVPNPFSGFLTKSLLSKSFQSGISPQISMFAAFIITFIQAILFNRIINHFNLLGKQTYLPALIFILLSSTFKSFLLLSPPLLCNFINLYILYRLLSVYKQTSALATMFDLGFFIAIGTLVYFPFVLMIMLLWLSLLLFRPFYWREWTSAIIGYTTVFFFLAVVYYWQDSLLDFIEIWSPLTSQFPFSLNIKLTDYTVLIPIATVLILGFIKLRTNFFKSFVQVRKAFQLLLFMFFIAAVSFYLNPDFNIIHFQLCIIPLAVLMSYYFLYAQKKWIYESLYIITVGFIFYFQFV